MDFAVTEQSKTKQNKNEAIGKHEDLSWGLKNLKKLNDADISIVTLGVVRKKWKRDLMNWINRDHPDSSSIMIC